MKYHGILTSASENGELLGFMHSRLSEDEETLFAQSFYMYLTENDTDFVVNLDDIWKWLGFSRKSDCKSLLTKHFTKGTHYIEQKSLTDIELVEEKSPTETTNELAAADSAARWGGSNKITILMTTQTFKKLCMKANTKKADTIHDYYVKLENILQEYIKDQHERKVAEMREQNLLIQSYNKRILYIFRHYKQVLIKYGITENNKERFKQNKNDLGKDFYLDYFWEFNNHRELERRIGTQYRNNRTTYNGLTEMLQFSSETDLKRFYDDVDLIKREIPDYSNYESLIIKESIAQKELHEVKLEILKQTIRLEKMRYEHRHEQRQELKSLEEEQRIEDYKLWLKDRIQLKEGAILKLEPTIKLFYGKLQTGDKAAPYIPATQETLDEVFPDQKLIREKKKIKGIVHYGWWNVCLKSGLDD